MIHAILRQTHIIGDVKSRLYIWNHGADLNSSGDFLSLRDEEFRQPELTKSHQLFSGRKRSLASLLWACHICLGLVFVLANTARIAMSTDGLSGHQIPEEYGSTKPFFKLAALIVSRLQRTESEALKA